MNVELYDMPVDMCAVCRAEIGWWAGTQAWLHNGFQQEYDHMATPSRLTDLKNHPKQVERWERRRARDAVRQVED